MALACVAAPARAEDAVELLQKSFAATQETPASGEQVTTVSQGARQQRTRQVVRRMRGRLKIRYVEPAPLRGQVALDDGTTFFHFFPRRKLVERGPSRLRPHASTAKQLRNIVRRGGQVTVEGMDTVAGRSASIVRVQTKDGLVRRYWVDRQNSVQLKVEAAERSGRVVTTTYTSVDFTPSLSAGEFAPSWPAGTTEVPARLGQPIPLARAREFARKQWGGLLEPSFLPDGLQFRAAFRMGTPQGPMVSLFYSNGQQSVTVFQGLGVAPARRQQFQMGQLAVVQSTRGRVNLAAVGPFDKERLQQILDSLK